ncbi:hypothetical protein B484DRAFT_429158, partial [Ochromonadaceae sp. CCMP2298]
SWERESMQARGEQLLALPQLSHPHYQQYDPLRDISPSQQDTSMQLSPDAPAQQQEEEQAQSQPLLDFDYEESQYEPPKSQPLQNPTQSLRQEQGSWCLPFQQPDMSMQLSLDEASARLFESKPEPEPQQQSGQLVHESQHTQYSYSTQSPQPPQCGPLQDVDLSQQQGSPMHEDSPLPWTEEQAQQQHLEHVEHFSQDYLEEPMEQEQPQDQLIECRQKREQQKRKDELRSQPKNPRRKLIEVRQDRESLESLLGSSSRSRAFYFQQAENCKIRKESYEMELSEISEVVSVRSLWDACFLTTGVLRRTLERQIEHCNREYQDALAKRRARDLEMSDIQKKLNALDMYR